MGYLPFSQSFLKVLSNLIGHIFKIISFYLLYRAIVETGIRKPFSLLWRELKLSEEQLRIQRNISQAYLDMAGAIILGIDANERVTMINKRGCEIIGAREDEIVGMNWFDVFVPEDVRAVARERFHKLLTSNGWADTYFELPVLDSKGRARIIAWHNSLLKDEKGLRASTLCSGIDITEKKQAEREREELIDHLRTALSKVKTLSGMLPICSSCKKIRDDKGYWRQVEVYIRDHSEAEFTHGICPDCFKKLYPEEEL